jgi:hypothetical protein
MIKVFKQIVCLILVALVLLQTFGTTIVLTDYQINKEYIAKVLCINKSKPKMHCNGKCHLKKELNKAEKKENSPANPLKEKSEIQLFSQHYSSLELFTSIQTTHNKYISDYSFPLSDKYLDSIFHPPQA